MATITRTPLSDIRLAIAAAITSIPAYGAPPDDVAHIPCAVIGPPSLEPTVAMAGYYAVSYPVLVIGRRYDFAEVHTELDDAAWYVIRDLELAPPTEPAGLLRVLRMVPNLVTVAGHEQPAHEITVVAQTMYCE